MIAKLTIGLTVVLTLASAVSAQTVLYDNFPNDTYQPRSGKLFGQTPIESESGPALTLLPTLGAGVDYYLNSITAPILHRNSSVVNEVTMSVYDTIDGVPGNLLETSTVVDLPPWHPTELTDPTTFTFSGSTVLEEGRTYWFIGSCPTGAGVDMVWSYNDSGYDGKYAERTSFSSNWYVTETTELAFRVVATPLPEPSSLMLLGLGGFALLRRRR
ncbi:MAG: PEP-CTERM sorting domain-containing protein [Phycisphaerae bacterium]|jgi:hypothetical protein